MLILRIHIRTSSQVLFNGFKVSAINSLNQRTIWIPAPRQHTSAIIVSRRCFICLQLSILQLSVPYALDN